jgi:hypothetical protein
MAVVTYRGVVRNGKVEPLSGVELPEGSEVYVVVPVGVSAQDAKRKANGWLVGHVGNMLMADRGALVQTESVDGPEWVWRFEVYVTSLAHEPFGPIGNVDVDAASGAIINSEQTKLQLYKRAQSS